MLRRGFCRQVFEVRVWLLALVITSLVIFCENVFLPLHQLPRKREVSRSRRVRSSSRARDGDDLQVYDQSANVNFIGDMTNDAVKGTAVETPYYLGCWLVPTTKLKKKSEKMTPGKCIKHCSRHQKRYALINNGDQCGCENLLHEYVTGSDCNRPCAGQGDLECGGRYTSSVYVVNEVYPSLILHDGEPRKVLLLAYMRTGSTFTSQMFSTYADSFYIFEPFFRLEKLKHLSVIQNLFSCQFDRVPKDVLIHQWNYWHRKHMQNSLSHFFACMSKLHLEGYYRCLPLATIACERSTLRIIKEIEITMEAAVTMQQLIPDLYVFHLVRDPRAVTNSRLQVQERNTPRHLDKYCNDVLKDIKASTKIPRENFYFLQYEKVSEYPLETVESLYNFINMTLTQEVLEWVKTATGMKDKCRGVKCIRHYSTVRKNSSATAYRWKASIPYKIVRYIDLRCKKVYRQLGYLPVSSEYELRNPIFKHRTW